MPSERLGQRRGSEPSTQQFDCVGGHAGSSSCATLREPTHSDQVQLPNSSHIHCQTPDASDPGGFDGCWEVTNDHPDIEQWLRRLLIRGTAVVDGVGQLCTLTKNEDNQLCLEGGILLMEDGLLHRIGKSHRVLSFRKCG